MSAARDLQRAGPVRDNRDPAEPAVVIVEDDDETRALYRTGLERAGLHVGEAVAAADALPLVAAVRPRVLVADLVLSGSSGSSGSDVCRAVRADPALRHTAIVVVTGLAGDAARAMLHDVTPDAVLIKPVDVDQFVATCVELCRRAEAMRAD